MDADFELYRIFEQPVFVGQLLVPSDVRNEGGEGKEGRKGGRKEGGERRKEGREDGRGFRKECGEGKEGTKAVKVTV